MKFHGDVRPLSHDDQYMGVVFEGDIDDAIQQAKQSPNHGTMPLHGEAAKFFWLNRMSRDRIALLQHLNLMPS
jgi:hypothetical protein